MTYAITPADFVRTIIRPALVAVNKPDPQHEMLLLGTALQETGLRDISQIGGGTGKGYFQMEDVTHDDCWNNYLNYKVLLAPKIRGLTDRGASQPQPEDLIRWPIYAAAMAAVKYLRCPGDIPNTLRGQAEYYKQFYNTPDGKATIDEYLDNWAAAESAGDMEGLWS